MSEQGQEAPTVETPWGPAEPLSESERDELERLRAVAAAQDASEQTAHHAFERGPEPDPASAGVPGTPGVRDHYDHLRPAPDEAA